MILHGGSTAITLNSLKMARISRRKKSAQYYLIYIIPAIIFAGLYLKRDDYFSSDGSKGSSERLENYSDLVSWANHNIVNVYCGKIEESKRHRNEDNRYYGRLEATNYWESSGYPQLRRKIMNDDLPKEYEDKIFDYVISEFRKCNP